jgi:hypothetical protein
MITWSAMGNSKHQAPNVKQTSNLKRQKPNNGRNVGLAGGVCRLGHWNLSFVCDLVLVIWSFWRPMNSFIYEVDH